MNIRALINKPVVLDIDDDLDDNPRAVIGGNNQPAAINALNPPAIATARLIYTSLSKFLANNPVIQSHEEAKAAANHIEQGRRTLGEMEDARKRDTKPLNNQVAAINDTYRGPREFITKVVDEIKRRLTAFATAEEERRQAAAREAARIAAEAERIAREAEAKEQDAIAAADVGECDVDVAGKIVEADKAFSRFKAAGRTAQRAAREVKVRVAGGFDRSMSMRKSETLILDDAHAALAEIGITEKITDAILSGAREYRKTHGRLPKGVSVETERKF